MEGFKTYRHESNPKEKEFHDKFIEHNSHNHNDMDFLVFGMGDSNGNFPANRLTEHEKKIVISTIQWLGSPVGQGFLRECGFIKKRKLNKKKEVN